VSNDLEGAYNNIEGFEIVSLRRSERLVFKAKE